MSWRRRQGGREPHGDLWWRYAPDACYEETLNDGLMPLDEAKALVQQLHRVREVHAYTHTHTPTNPHTVPATTLAHTHPHPLQSPSWMYRPPSLLFPLLAQVRPVQLMRVSTNEPLHRFATFTEASSNMEVPIDRISKVRFI